MRARQKRLLVLLGLAAGVSATGLLFTLGALASLSFPRLGHALVLWALPIGVAAGAGVAWSLIRKRIGNDERTARLMSELMPELKLDLLAAVELSKALGERHDFSPELAKAFLASVDERSFSAQLDTLREGREAKWAIRGAVALSVVCLASLFFARERVSSGLTVAFAPRLAAALKREPITGDFTVHYRYPAYTGLEPRTVEGGTGDLQAPAGTEVTIDTRADRDVLGAALSVNGKRFPLVKDGRKLKGDLLLDKPGQYHVVFLDGDDVVAEGPDRAIRIDADTAPEVQLTAPLAELEIEADHQKVLLKYEARDDYGLSSLELVAQRPGRQEERTRLTHDDGRVTRSVYEWDVGALKLQPGQSVRYYLEAKDNDAVAGPKRGVSRTQTVKLYSAAEHRQEALAKAEKIWDRLIVHLADRMEGQDRKKDINLDQVKAGAALDESGQTLSNDSVTLAVELAKDKDAPEELGDALENIGSSLHKVVLQTTMARRVAERLHGTTGDFSISLARKATEEVRSVEQDVLYLEALLDRQRLEALRQAAQDLKSDRRELSRLMEEYAKTPDSEKQQALLDQMQQLQRDMERLLQKMSELSKGIRDEHYNAEAQNQLDSANIPDDFKSLEELIKSGKTEEALKKMQELAMEMDDLVSKLDDAADDAEENADPELERQFEEFQKNLDETVQKQAQLADDSERIRDRYRDEVRKRVQQKAEQLGQNLLKKTEDLKQHYEKIDGTTGGTQLEVSKAATMQQLDHLEQALKAKDYDLALEAADQLTAEAERAAGLAEEQRRRDEQWGNPAPSMRAIRETEQKFRQGSKAAEDIDSELRNLFPPPNQMLSQEDQQKLKEQAARQKQLQQKADQLEQQMDQLAAQAPIFGPDQKEQMEQAQQKMGEARDGLDGKDVRKANGNQQAALDSLKSLQRGMQQQQQQQPGSKGKRGLPMPMGQRRPGGRGSINKDKVEIPDEDPNAPTKEIRKDLMDAMKQGAPDRYREQNKRYYEELVK
ncbi:MAG: DUF4175 family protein [Myxococcaceae bacterium]